MRVKSRYYLDNYINAIEDNAKNESFVGYIGSRNLMVVMGVVAMAVAVCMTMVVAMHVSVTRLQATKFKFYAVLTYTHQLEL